MRQVFLKHYNTGSLYVEEEDTKGELLGSWWISVIPIKKEQRLPTKAYREYKGIK
jgi:hypothetical protein